MKVLRRTLIAITCGLSLVSAAASPASGHSEYITYHRAETVICPHPMLLHTDFGALNLCVQRRDNSVRAGFYSPLTDHFNPQSDWRHIREHRLFVFDVVSTDGVAGSFRGYYAVDLPGAGRITWGAHYSNYGSQPIGRWGNYNHHTRMFHPSGDFLAAEHPF